MNRSILIYAGILVLSLGASYLHYTAEEVSAREGVMVLEARKDDLKSIAYESPDLKVTVEMRDDPVGRYAWVTVDEVKKKKVDGVETTEQKLSRFKGGSAADKLIESTIPLAAVRRLENVDDERVASFGLKTPDTKVTYTVGGKATTFELGGETYGTKDRYARDVSTGLLYVIDDELFKPLKFANSRLPERSLVSPKPEELDSLSVTQGATVVQWTQKNKEDKDARYWSRDTAVAPAEGAEGPTAGGKDETFSNWVEKLLKLKSTAYVQEADTPADLVLQFEFTVRVKGKPEETVQVLKAEDGWFARSNFTRGLVKLAKTTAEDLTDEVDDILAGRAPPEKPKPAPRMPPTKGPAGDAAKDGPPRPPMAPPGMPRPTMPIEPKPKPAGEK